MNAKAKPKLESIEGDPGASTEASEVAALLLAAEQRAVFGPRFFLTHLPGLIRDRCPDPVAGLPRVSLHLSTGAVLDVCHIVGLGPRWVALAVFEGGEGASPTMRTELVPFETILRVSIRLPRTGERAIGFRQDREPTLHETCVVPELS